MALHKYVSKCNLIRQINPLSTCLSTKSENQCTNVRQHGSNMCTPNIKGVYMWTSNDTNTCVRSMTSPLPQLQAIAQRSFRNQEHCREAQTRDPALPSPSIISSHNHGTISRTNPCGSCPKTRQDFSDRRPSPRPYFDPSNQVGPFPKRRKT